MQPVPTVSWEAQQHLLRQGAVLLYKKKLRQRSLLAEAAELTSSSHASVALGGQGSDKWGEAGLVLEGEAWPLRAE